MRAPFVAVFIRRNMAAKKQSGPSSAEARDTEVPFEKAMEQLESIVESMESEKLPLDNLVKKYEEGTKLLKICQSRIAAAQKKIELIAKEAEGDDFKLTPFESDEESEASDDPGDDSDEARLL